MIGLTNDVEKNERHPETTQRYPKTLSLDDSTLAETGKKIEGVSRVYAHGNNTYPVGYTLLALIVDGRHVVLLCQSH